MQKHAWSSNSLTTMAESNTLATTPLPPRNKVNFDYGVGNRKHYL